MKVYSMLELGEGNVITSLRSYSISMESVAYISTVYTILFVSRHNDTTTQRHQTPKVKSFQNRSHYLKIWKGYRIALLAIGVKLTTVITTIRNVPTVDTVQNAKT
jgi:hypothetical protein